MSEDLKGADLNDLERRVAGLERSAKRLRRMAWVRRSALVIVLLIALAYSNRPVADYQVVRAQHFAVVDQGGKQLAQLGLSTDSGNAVLSIGVSGETGQSILGVYDDGTPRMVLVDAAGTRRGFFGVTGSDVDRGAYLLLLDSAGEVGGSLSATEGISLLSLGSRTSNNVQVIASDTPQSAMMLTDSLGQPRVVLGAQFPPEPLIPLVGEHNASAETILFGLMSQDRTAQAALLSLPGLPAFMTFMDEDGRTPRLSFPVIEEFKPEIAPVPSLSGI